MSAPLSDAHSDATATFARWFDPSRGGSLEALGQLLDAYRPYLLHLANAEVPADLRGKLAGSDLVQQTFLEAGKDFAAFRGTTEEELLSWLRRIFRNNLANCSRLYHTGMRRVGREVSLDDSGALPGGADALPANGPSPSGAVMAREQIEALEKAIARLGEEDREVIVQRARDKRSFVEIGQAMGRSADAVRKMWSRAVERLQTDLESRP